MCAATVGTERELSRYRYGDGSLWVLSETLGGSKARLLREQVDLHFREVGGPLVIDLRGAAFIDCEGAAALESAAGHHPGLKIVGLPREHANLPRRTRVMLRMLRPETSIEEAFAAVKGRLHDDLLWKYQRRHARITVQMPVEILLGNTSSAAILHDLSLGGGRLAHLPRSWLRELEPLPDSPEITITGLNSDPLGREITRRYRSAMLASRPVHIVHESTALGVQFSPPDRGGPA